MFNAICILASLLVIYLIVDSVKNVIQIFKRSKFNSEEKVTADDNSDEK